MVMLVAEGTRIVPCSSITLRQLELLTELLLSEHFHVVQEALIDTVYETFLLADSIIALSWI